MCEAKTVGSANSDLVIFTEQMNDVSNMRASLLSIDKSDPLAATKAIKNVTLLRVYHQVESIVRYTEMMDKIQDRIYQSIDAKLDNADPDDDSLWITLVPLAERMQRTMIDSHKLLEPYLNVDQLASFEIPEQQDPNNSFTTMILDQESREKVRTSAQEVLAAISALESLPQDKQEEELKAVQTKAQEAIAKLSSENKEESEETEESEEE